MFSTTIRWNDGVDGGRYDAVEVTGEGLVWYAWSHVHGRGRHDEQPQSLEAFLREGPLRAMPPHAAKELEGLVRARVDRRGD